MTTLSPERIKLISKASSLILRHRPDLVGLEQLPAGGWVSTERLLRALNRRFKVSREELDYVVRENDKQRFSYSASGTHIRANQGHSVPVDLGLQPATPPGVLFHGTVDRSIASIRTDGLSKMARHAVHLSVDIATASNVGSRRGNPVILTIDSARMAADGHIFYLSDNGVWLTDSVPSEYISFPTA